ncbi:Uncharacterised protein [Bordetella pertussis]|nr:Uncharacterised protein [Bordetella pertussis]CFW07466.1 Uncharacterised protein [Bordetella pertussis]CPL82819.1 Uncharacterised protein [Bordetella pertussis]CPN50675.1 Uncharacterised protein [Bordetella pertussis]
MSGRPSRTTSLTRATSETVCSAKLTSELEMLPCRGTAISRMAVMRMDTG